MKKDKDKLDKSKKVKKNKKKEINVLNKIKNFLVNLSIFDSSEKATYSFKEVVIIMFFSLGLGFLTCFSFVKIFDGGKDYIALKKDLGKIVDTYYAIKDNYYGELDKDRLVDAAVEGMVNAVGDVYTSYSSVDNTDEFMQTVSGVYEGIGCTVAVNLDGNVVVVDMFEGSPSEKAGLKVGDIIVKVDDNSFSGKSSTDVSEYIKTSSNEIVKLEIIRNDETKVIEVKREKIEIPYVSGEIFEKEDKKIGYIDITLFSSISSTQFKNELLKLEENDISGLIIDVRGNSGGYLSSVTEILNMILPKGKVVYKLEDEDGITVKKDDTKEKRSYPIAVLTNGSSASASEILASAIKESYGGFVVGTNTYGKGTVQQTTTLPDGSMIKYTVQNWLTPDGNWINEVGVEPTDVIELAEEYIQNPCNDTDNQLQKALELVINK